MIKIEITDKQRERAKEIAPSTPYARSVMGVYGNLIGALGEVVVFDYLRELGLNPRFEHKTTHDISFGGKTIDVKTKARTIEPKPHYDCTVPDYNHDHQRPDYFVFVSLMNDDNFSAAWILGCATYDFICQSATLWKRGQVDDRNAHEHILDEWKLEINQLQSIETIREKNMAYEQKDNAGALFINDKRETDKHPNAKGSAMIGGVEYWVSAWTNTSQKGTKYQSLSFQPKDQQAISSPTTAEAPLEDEMPF